MSQQLVSLEIVTNPIEDCVDFNYQFEGNPTPGNDHHAEEGIGEWSDDDLFNCACGFLAIDAEDQEAARNVTTFRRV